MYICVAGKNNIAVDVLDYLIKINNGRYDLCVICNESRGEILGFQKSLARFSECNSIPVVSLEEVYDYDNLIFLSMEFDKIVVPAKFKNARLYNIHFSLLPAYKGMYTSAIPILNGEKVTGVTFHRIDNGIDTGDIIGQEQIEIKEKDTCRDLYIKYLNNGAILVKKYIEDVIENREKVNKQSYEGASYYSKGYIDYNNLKINFKDVAVSVERQIRAFSFREYQMPMFSGTGIISCEISNYRSKSKPGTVIYENDKYYQVSTIDYDVILYKDKYDEMFEECRIGNLEAIKDICTAREHIEIVEEHGWTPLIVATYYNNYEIVKYLIEMGANIHVKNYHETNLLMYAKEVYKKYGDRRLFDLFIDLGLNINEKDAYGYSVVDYVKKENIMDLI